jgi:hypothetical protein
MTPTAGNTAPRVSLSPWVYGIALVYFALHLATSTRYDDFFGPQYGLPKAISGHQNYFLWGPRQYTGDIMILMGEEEAEARKHFESVTVAATLNNRYAYRYENRPVLVCRGLKWNLQTDWARVKKWR